MSNYLVYDSVFERHETGPSHPEGPDRVTVIRDGCQQVDDPPWTVLDPERSASFDEIEYVHTSQYIEEVERASARGRALDADTPVSEESYDTALLAAGSALELSDRSREERSRGFGAIRPPGHHAEPNKGMGFCLFNNIAVAAHELTKNDLDVAIVDIDVHHGNGTQTMFYDRRDVLYCSFHQSPFYPGTGRENETGDGAGEGFTVNVPLSAGSDWSALQPSWEEEIGQKIRSFEPDILLVSAGFDAHRSDPVGGLNLEDEDYVRLGKDLRKWSEEFCEGRVVGLLEGGYNRKTLERIVPEFIESLFE